MEISGPEDALPARPLRVLVAGTSGSGKTTLAARIEAVLGLPHSELDALHHGPNWTPRPTFAADVAQLAAQDEWVCEWQYSSVRGLLAGRADLLVWLDLPRRTVMRQVVLRTLRRRWRREVLWNGNVEGPLHSILTERDHVVRWAWTTHARTADRVLAAQRPDLVIVRLRSRADVERWCRGPLRAVADHPLP